MVKILFDHQTFSMQRFGGISRYFANLYNGINQQEGYLCDLSLLYTQNHYLSNQSFPLTGLIGNSLLKKESRRYKWNKWYSRYEISENNFDIFHPTYYHPYFLKKLHKPFVLTVHDMIHELFPEYFTPKDPFTTYKRLLIEKATHFIAISQSTKDDLQKIYSIPDTKITVIHHGFTAPPFKVMSTNTYNVPENYILFVGDRSGYKNFFKFISAITPILGKYSEITVICSGGGPFNIVEQEFLIRNKIHSRVKQINVSDEELGLLYKNALLFVYPSLYEGFGLPLLEAFYYNCPVVASNTSCFKEVGGDAVVYFDPLDINDIKNAILAVLENNELRMQLKISAGEQLKQFSFQQCLEKTLSVYRAIALV